MSSPPTSCLLKVKSKPLPEQLEQLYEDLDFGKLRYQRPSRFIFLCGGALSDNTDAAISMRHYLLKTRKIAPKLKAEIILAETANQLYRDSSYADLISFEEDVARISAMILVIAESAGSLAEVGAFSANDTIRQSLTVLMQTKYADQESFIRYGPIEKIMKEDRERVGFFPWRTNKSGGVIKTSIAPHVTDIIQLINSIIEKIPQKSLLHTANEIKTFILIYWIIHLSIAIPMGRIREYLKTICALDVPELRKKLYCMRLVGWIDFIHYSNIDYFYCKQSLDPIEYHFKDAVAVTDSVRRKVLVADEIQKELSLPRHVRQVAVLGGKGAK